MFAQQHPVRTTKVYKLLFNFMNFPERLALAIYREIAFSMNVP